MFAMLDLGLSQWWPLRVQFSGLKCPVVRGKSTDVCCLLHAIRVSCFAYSSIHKAEAMFLRNVDFHRTVRRYVLVDREVFIVINASESIQAVERGRDYSYIIKRYMELVN
jgi:hypothetical protein